MPSFGSMRDLTGDAAHLLAQKPGLADRVLVVVKNDGKFFCRRRLGRLLGDRDVIGEFGLTTKTAIGRVFFCACRHCRLDAAAGFERSERRPSVRSR